MISDEEFLLLSSSEATILSGFYWMHGWYDLCFYGASQLFPLCDLLSPSGSSPCVLYHILLPRRI